LFSLPGPGSALQELDVRLRTRSRGFFFGSTCTLLDLDGAMMSSQLLRRHVDRGLRDMGTMGPR
jgi:hypothetical protein